MGVASVEPKVAGWLTLTLTLTLIRTRTRTRNRTRTRTLTLTLPKVAGWSHFRAEVLPRVAAMGYTAL